MQTPQISEEEEITEFVCDYQVDAVKDGRDGYEEVLRDILFSDHDEDYDEAD